jgi:putative nucleotidyltransferase with HDIG domain
MFQRVIRLRLHWNIWLLTAAIIVGMALTTIFVVNYEVRTKLNPIVEEELIRNTKLVRLDLVQKVDGLQKLCQELAESPRLKGSLGPTVDPMTLPPIASAMRPMIPTDLFLVTADDSVRYVDANNNVPSNLFYSVMTQNSIRLALQGGVAEDVWNIGHKSYVTVSVPIRTLSGVVGSLTLGYELTDKKNADEIYANYGISVTFLSQNHILSTTLNPDEQNEFTDFLRKNPIFFQAGSSKDQVTTLKTEDVTLGRERYLMIPTSATFGRSGKVDYAVLLSREKYSQLPRDIQVVLILVSSIAAVMALVLSFIITKTISGPRERLINTMSDISHSGDLTQRISIRSNDVEMKTLVETFNSMMVTLDKSQLEKEESYVEAIQAVVVALDTRDSETHGHSERVVKYTMALADQLKVPEENLKAIRWGALLHDVGKIGISDAILRKPGPLTDQEWVEMKKHPTIGYTMLRGIRFLEPALPLVLHHQEKFNGSGYPNGLKGKDIPLGARIFAVTDAFDAMTSDRPYRSARTFEQAVEEIKKGSGTQFDPELVEAFLCISKEQWIQLKQI